MTDFTWESSEKHGLLQRHYSVEPVGSVVPTVEGDFIIPRVEWPELIARQEALETSPFHCHKYHHVPVLNQGSLKYCWAYSVVAGVMNRLAFQGIDPAPYLSATAVAAIGKNFRNQGGHCSQACAMIQEQGGIPTVDVWPEQSVDRQLAHSESVEASRQSSQLVKFVDLGQNLDGAISMMLCDTPVPVTFSLPWWRHAVLGLQVVDADKSKPANKLERYGIRFVNSYGSGWQKSGFGTFFGRKMEAWEYIAITQTMPTREE